MYQLKPFYWCQVLNVLILRKADRIKFDNKDYFLDTDPKCHPQTSLPTTYPSTFLHPILQHHSYTPCSDTPSRHPSHYHPQIPLHILSPTPLLHPETPLPNPIPQNKLQALYWLTTSDAYRWEGVWDLKQVYSCTTSSLSQQEGNSWTSLQLEDLVWTACERGLQHNIEYQNI